MPVRVLFVCLGNICRSPMAEAVFRQLVDEAGLSDEIEVDSAGTGSWHVGERAHPGTLNLLAKKGIHYAGRARQIGPEDFARFDYILALDSENLAALNRLKPPGSRAVLARFMDFAPEELPRDVPDPYYSGRFQEVYDLVHAGAEALLAHIRQQEGL